MDLVDVLQNFHLFACDIRNVVSSVLRWWQVLLVLTFCLGENVKVDSGGAKGKQTCCLGGE